MVEQTSMTRFMKVGGVVSYSSLGANSARVTFRLRILEIQHDAVLRYRKV